MFADAVPMKIKIMRSSAPGCSARRMQLVLIDGTELTRLMVRCDMGVTAKGRYRRWLDRSTMQESSDEGSVPVGQNESLVVDRAYETWNSGDVSGLKELYAADADVAIPGATVRGRDQVGALWGAFISAFPDGQLTELLRLDCGTYIVSENNLSGTHTAPLVTPQGEVPATGNHV